MHQLLLSNSNYLSNFAQDRRNTETWISVKTLWDFAVDIVDHWTQFHVEWLRRPNFHSGEIMSVLTMHKKWFIKKGCKIILSVGWTLYCLACCQTWIMLLTRCIFKILIILSYFVIFYLFIKNTDCTSLGSKTRKSRYY